MPFNVLKSNFYEFADIWFKKIHIEEKNVNNLQNRICKFFLKFEIANHTQVQNETVSFRKSKMPFYCILQIREKLNEHEKTRYASMVFWITFLSARHWKFTEVYDLVTRAFLFWIGLLYTFKMMN